MKLKLSYSLTYLFFSIVSCFNYLVCFIYFNDLSSYNCESFDVFRASFNLNMASSNYLLATSNYFLSLAEFGIYLFLKTAS